MFKFNNDHIFTGYLKQLLASFNLPKCRVYTEEQEKFKQKYDQNYAEIENLIKQQQDLTQSLADISASLSTAGLVPEYINFLTASKTALSEELQSIEAELAKWNKGELNIIPTHYHSVYDRYPNTEIGVAYKHNMRYVPYIKNGQLQVYVDGQWRSCHEDFNDPEHNKVHKTKGSNATIIPYAYGQKILNYTKNLKIQNTVYDSYTHEYLGDYLRFHRDFANINLMPLYNCFSNRSCPRLNLTFNVGQNYEAIFKTEQSSLYNYYMVPVKFFKDYTIAMDCEAGIELCCCIYDEYHNSNEDFAELPKLTYQCFNAMQFNKPVLYSKIHNLTSQLIQANTNSDLCQQEDSLKLILKVPASNKSSIVILEGNYTSYNDMILYETVKDTETILQRKTNKTVINYEDLDACEVLAGKLITPLQLLRTNTGESYPFADRLVEYLCGNAITVNETISDNVVRAKKVISMNCNPKVYPMVAEDGIWEPILQCLVYDYINQTAVTNTHDINHDILGFIDKDVEKWYSATGDNGQNTIANIEIYN